MSKNWNASHFSLVRCIARRRQEDGEDGGKSKNSDTGEAEEEIEGVPGEASNAECSQSLLGEEAVDEGADIIVAGGSHGPLREHQRQTESQPTSQRQEAAGTAGCTGLNALRHVHRSHRAELGARGFLLAEGCRHEALLRGQHQQQAAAHQNLAESHGVSGSVARAGSSLSSSLVAESTKDTWKRLATCTNVADALQVSEHDPKLSCCREQAAPGPAASPPPELPLLNVHA